MHMLAVLLSGFSVFSALIMTLTHFRCDNYKGQLLAQGMGVILLLTLVGLQLTHFFWLQGTADFVHTAYYQVLLFAVAPAFYLFSKPLLQADSILHPYQLLHLLPVLAAPLLPFSLALPLAFAVGAGYLLWLAYSIHALRSQRSRFRLELAILGTVFAIALAVLLLGLGLPLIPEKLFFTLYASAIGIAFLLVSIVLSLAPQLSTEVAEAARETYAVSTLGNVDCAHMLVRLGNLMDQEQVFQNPDMDLPTLAERMQLTPHQLSELINTRLGKGFSRYIREYRVEAAEDLLLDKPSMPVLTVGMEVGFTSQSNFYQAFREMTGMTPGQYRKVHLQVAA
ncbi:MAG: helix-turn-helix domain-containing protein [Gammaproteobacteria bacterium]|nr:helix-turn-helix domain-containing protein [Gammaproteobacteria bacterium]MBU1724881.1 helix-turn-helix domain-containing protein [Gammaproteobacteria bacterium]MBU2004915.1 helix-turn-helix domain-containing protein [Gammaproteobacteria bacterium]